MSRIGGRCSIRSIVIACLAAATIGVFSPIRAVAQQIRGTLRDSTSREPIAGAVVLLLDASSRTIVRGLTDAHGGYRLTSAPSARRLEFLHIGFRPREVTLPASVADEATFDVTMAAIPTLLEPVHVSSGAKCSARDDRLTALSLLDQARAALLGSVVARDERPASQMMRLRFTTLIDAKSGRPISMHVVADSTADPRISFEAPRSALSFVDSGFISDNHGVQRFDGPDAETLIDDGFLDGYCFELRDPDAARPHQVGLGFTAASSRNGRVDIDGTLWVDTLARQIEDIRFEYRGLSRGEMAVRPGGSIHFRQLSNGTVLIDRWSLRLPTAQPETTYHFGGPTISTIVGVQETGGAIAAARWPDGFSWEAPLDTLHVQLSGDSTITLGGRQLALVGTPYRGVSDAKGIIVIPRLLAGPYEGLMVDSTLASTGIYFKNSFKFSAADTGSTHVPVKLESPSHYVISQCTNGKKERSVTTDLLVVGRITDAFEEPLKDVDWQLFKRNGPTRAAVATGRTEANGLFAYCGASLGTRESLEIDTRRSSRAARRTTVIPVEKSLVVAAVEAENKKLLGVYDNKDGQWVVGATIRDTLGNEAKTSSIGVASLNALTPIAGYYLLEIRKPGYAPRFIRLRDDTTSEILTGLAPNPLGGTTLPTTVVTADRKLATDAGLKEGFGYRCGTGLISCVGRAVLDRKTAGTLDNLVDHVDGIARTCGAGSGRPELAGTHAGGAAPNVSPGAAPASGSCPIKMYSIVGNGLNALCTPNYVVNGFEWQGLGGDAQAELDQFLTASTIDGMEIYLPGHPVPKRFDPLPFNNCGVIVIWTR
jgi:hypothetical protein